MARSTSKQMKQLSLPAVQLGNSNATSSSETDALVIMSWECRFSAEFTTCAKRQPARVVINCCDETVDHLAPIDQHGTVEAASNGSGHTESTRSVEPHCAKIGHWSNRISDDAAIQGCKP